MCAVPRTREQKLSLMNTQDHISIKTNLGCPVSLFIFTRYWAPNMPLIEGWQLKNHLKKGYINSSPGWQLPFNSLFFRAKETKPSLTYKETAGLTQLIASPRAKELEGSAWSLWWRMRWKRFGSHLIYMDWLAYNENLSPFALMETGEANPVCVTCKKAPFNQSAREVLSSVGGSEMIGKVEKEESRKQRSFSLMEGYFIRLIRNMCFPQTGKPSWKTSSHKGFGWKQAPPGTRCGGGGGREEGVQLVGELAGDSGGRRFSCGRFPGEVPFQELKILHNVQNFEKSKRLWTFLSGNSTVLKETRWLATTNPDPGKT